MEVTEARQAFYRCNEKHLEDLLSAYEPNQQSAIRLIPLLFQTNHRLLPGYNGPDTPAGIYAYKPDNALISLAHQMNNRFHYQQETALKNTIIDAIYLQRDLIDNELRLWVIHIPGLKPDQRSELHDKLQRILMWLNSRDIRSTGMLVTSEQLANASQLDVVAEKYISPVLFLDHFYVEACLLAGKYPVWWLVPPEQEREYDAWVQHLYTARYVNNEEYINLGGLANVSQNDILRQAIRLVHGLYRSTETSWLRLLLMAAKALSWPNTEGPGWRYKAAIYASPAEQHVSAIAIISAIIHDAIKQPGDDQQRPIARIFHLLGKLSRNPGRELLLQLGASPEYRQVEHQREKIDVVSFLDVYKSLFREIRQTFSQIVTQYNYHAQGDEQQQELNTLARNMMVYLSESDNRVPVYNTRNRAEYIIGRVLLRQQAGGDADRSWSLVIEQEEGQQRTLGGFPSLLSLMAWAWLNRIVDQSTQVSLDCPSRVIRQVEARHVLEVLIQQLDPDVLLKVPDEVFEHASVPMRSLLFTNLLAGEQYRQAIESGEVLDPLLYEAGDELLINCEQLVINNWGDVHCRQYSGNQGILQCLCDWTHQAELTRASRPHAINCYGYAAGISTFWAQRIEQVYEELVQFFFDAKKINGRFIIRMGPEYFLVEAIDNQLQPRKIGNQAALFVFLEQASEEFRPSGLDRYTLTETPLRAIFERNTPDVVQVFYQVINRHCYTWVLDENGSLWRDEQQWFERGSYVAHWLYLMRSVRNRLKRINYQNRELPSIEIQQISSNQLGGLDFYPLGAEAITGERSFIDIQVSVVGDEAGDRISLVCDGRDFSYQQYQERVISECVQYIHARMANTGRKPIYVTDIDVPLRLFGVKQRDDIQVLHFLKYKRNIEARLNRLIGG